MFAVPMDGTPQRPEVVPPAPLPAGRHGLSREHVVANQRQRILGATLRAAAERGYAGMHVEDIIRGAGVSRRTFYEQFANKQEAFLAAFDMSAALLLAAVRDAY